MRGWGVRFVLGLMALSLVVTGVGWNEPALAAAPDLHPILIPGVDVHAAMDWIDCLSVWSPSHYGCFW